MELKKFNLLFIKLNLVLALIILTLSLTLAVSDTSGGNLVGKQGDTIMLPQECASCTYVTVTSIQYPNLTRIYLNAPMTQQGSSYDYEFSDTNLLGEYTYCGVGDVDATDTTFCNDFEITPTGESYDQTQQGIVVALGVVMALFIGIGFSFTKEKWKLRGFFFVMAMFFGVILLNSIRVLAGGSLILGDMTTSAMLIGIIAVSFMAVYLLIIYTIEIFKTMKNKKEMRWQVSDRFN
jgi:hypothetical protein